MQRSGPGTALAGGIHTRERGEGAPVLILHGGWLDHRHMLDAVEPVFEGLTGWRRIYADIPGHGLSEGAELASHDAVLERLLAFVDALAPSRGLVLVGESRGGYLARGIAHARPDRIDGMALIVPGRTAVTPPELRPEHRTILADPALAATLPEAERKRFDRLVVQTPAILEKIRRTKIPATALTDPAYQARIDAAYEFAFDVDADRFERPALVLLGRQDAMEGYARGLALTETMPRATVAVLDRAGHALSWEQPGLFRALMRDWLARVEEDRAGRTTGGSR